MLPSNPMRVFGLVLVSLMTGAWVIGMAGLARATDLCNENATASDCASSTGLDWWIILFELGIIVVSILSLFVEFLARHKATLTSFYNINTALLCVMAHKYCTSAYDNRNGSGKVFSAMAACAAGVVMLTMFNFVWLIVYTDPSPSPSHDGSAAPSEPRGTKDQPSNTATQMHAASGQHIPSAYAAASDAYNPHYAVSMPSAPQQEASTTTSAHS